MGPVACRHNLVWYNCTAQVTILYNIHVQVQVPYIARRHYFTVQVVALQSTPVCHSVMCEKPVLPVQVPGTCTIVVYVNMLYDCNLPLVCKNFQWPRMRLPMFLRRTDEERTVQLYSKSAHGGALVARSRIRVRATTQP